MSRKRYTPLFFSISLFFPDENKPTQMALVRNGLQGIVVIDEVPQLERGLKLSDK